MQQPSNNTTNNNDSNNLLVTQPSSAPNSPIANSPSAQSSSSFCLHSSALSINQESENPTNDPNWQANKASVRERNAVMFNNELMADVKFLVGCEGIF
jgi:BTB/POZ domain-containing protein 3/6